LARNFEGISGEMFEFFLMISANNSKSFFEAHREQYEEHVKKPLWLLADDCEETLHGIDENIECRPSKCVSRIRRATLFSRDKTPYRNYMWIDWRDRGKEELSGERTFSFFFSVSLGGIMSGAGYYGLVPHQMARLREKIDLQSERFEEIINDKALERFVLSGQDYKKIAVPGHLSEKAKALYIKKGFSFTERLSISEENMTQELCDRVRENIEALAPLYEFIEL